MPISEEIHVNADVQAGGARPAKLRPSGEKLFSLPGLRAFRSLARRVYATAEPAGRLYIRRDPDRQELRLQHGLTVMSANLCHDWPRYRRLSERLEDFARLVELQGADVILLQEVARTAGLRSDEWLSERLGMAYVYSRANGHLSSIGFEEGLAVFSRFSLGEPQLAQLGRGTNPFVRRLALGVMVESPHGRLWTVSVHLGLTRRQNIHQLAHLRTWVAEVAGDTPALIGGDFNAHESSAQILQAKRFWLDTFRHLHPHADGVTHELRWPWGNLLRRARLDYIFLRPGLSRWNVMEARHLAAPSRPHSDHRAVLTRLSPIQLANLDKTHPISYS